MAFPPYSCSSTSPSSSLPMRSSSSSFVFRVVHSVSRLVVVVVVVAFLSLSLYHTHTRSRSRRCMNHRRSSGGSSTACSPGQLLVLIGSDGRRATISRAIATEASYVLRDLLDGVEGAPGAVGASSPSAAAGGDDRHGQNSSNGGCFNPLVEEEAAAAAAPASSPSPAHTLSSQLDDLFLGSEKAAQHGEGEDAKGTHSQSNARPKPQRPLASTDSDIIDFLFNVKPESPLPPPPSGEAPSAATTAAAAAAAHVDRKRTPTQLDSLFDPVPEAPSPTTEDAIREKTSSQGPPQQLPPLHPSSHAVSPAPTSPSTTPQHHRASRKGGGGEHRQPPLVPPVELPFPYFTGEVLQMVCQHMAYRFRISGFGTGEDGCFRVYPTKAREIPRPMTLPLVDYLDGQDRQFIQHWDELTTVLMVKCATLLNYEELLTLASAKLATFLLERSTEGLRTLLSVDSDFTPQEEAELKKEC